MHHRRSGEGRCDHQEPPTFPTAGAGLARETWGAREHRVYMEVRTFNCPALRDFPKIDETLLRRTAGPYMGHELPPARWAWAVVDGGK
jgi:hypothetical protein